MRSEATLDTAVFQLTPTRTRCDLVIISNSKKETLASGLLNPFLTHLKIAQDQIAKGGYSIILEPDPEIDAAWFTKGTVERFVRFVSTPEVLESVTNIELEILQIDNAITIQSNDNLALHTAADHRLMPAEAPKGIKTSVDVDEDKTIVLFKPGPESNQPDSNGSTRQENSKVQLFRVLETRKMVLCKAQGMAFARAAAAGFDIDKMVDLISFAENFGATRLKEACIKYVELWKKKHETGQWLEVESSEAMSMQSEFSALYASGIVFAADSMIQKDHGDAQSISGGDMVTDNNGKVDKCIPSDAIVSMGHQEHSQGQHQHLTYPQWRIHPPTRHSVFQPYNMQGMPYYHNYPGSIPYFHPPCPPMEDPRFDISHRKGLKRQSIRSKDIKYEACGSSTRSQDDTDESTSDLEVDGSHDHKSHERVGQAGKKKSNVVVIENLNYIASKKNGLSESESKSQSDFESEVRKEYEGSHSYMRENKNKRSAKEPDEYFEAYSNEKAAHGGEADSGNWQAFQNFLLRAEEKSRRVDEDMFAGEKEHPSKLKQSKGEADPVVPPKRDYGDFHDQRLEVFDSVHGRTRRMKQAASDDPVLVSRNGVLTDNQIKEVESSREYRVKRSDELVIYGHRKQFNSKRSSDPFIDHRDEHDGNAMTSSSHKIRDESFMLPYRSRVQDIGSGSQTTIDMDSEFPSALQKAKEAYDKVKSQFIYEPSDLVPERGNESLSVGYDPAMEYDLAVPFGNSIKLEASKPEGLSTSTKEAYKKSNKDKNLNSSKDSMEKRRKDAPLKQGLSSRFTPLTAAQKRAENLRIYKANLQKVKKEREEEEQKRLEALKGDRQKRKSSRNSSTATQLPLTPQQTKALLPTKPLPSTFKSSKFSDSHPVSSSPLCKLPLRTSSTGSNDHQKATKPSRTNGSNHGLDRSTSSLPVPKKGSNGLLPEVKANSLRTKRLSDLKSSYIQHTSSVKSMASKQVPQRSIPDESQKKISAIMQLDQSKSASLPEIRVKTTKASAERIEKDSSGKDTLKKGSGSKAFRASGTMNGKVLKDTVSNSDENLVTEKTFMMLENNMFTAPSSQQSGKMLDIKERLHGDGLLTGSEVMNAPPSPVVMAQAEDSDQSKLDKQPSTREVVVVPYSRNEPQKLFSSIVREKPHQAPYTSATSLNDSLPTNQGYERGQLAPESATVATRIMNFEILSLGDQIPEAHEKHRNKEIRGLRKLLKFARKSHSSVGGEGKAESDASSVNDQTTSAGSPNDVHILKNLISQDDTGGTPAKVSRPFSLLSPFRSKNSQRNLIT